MKTVLIRTEWAWDTEAQLRELYGEDLVGVRRLSGLYAMYQLRGDDPRDWRRVSDGARLTLRPEERT